MVTKEIFTAQLDERMAYMDFVVDATSARRDTWQSKEQAFEYFKTRIPWKYWDPPCCSLTNRKFTFFHLYLPVT